MIRFLPRAAGMLILLALSINALALHAQDDTITVVGSGIITPIIEAVTETAGVENVEVNVTGTNSGFNTFCLGEADITTATRAISEEEEIACGSVGVQFLELLAGHNILAIVANPESELPACLDASELNTLFAPSAQGTITNLNQLNPAYADVTLELNLPPADSANYALLDNLVGGVGLRSDITAQADEQAIVTAVSENPAALGIVSYPVALAAGESVKLLEINPEAGSGCAAPSAENVENRLYSAADRLMVYVNTASLGKAGMPELLAALTSESANEAVEAAGFTPITADALTTNADIVGNVTVGRQFSRDMTAFEIPEQIFGAVTLGGSAHGYEYIQNVTTNFTGQYPTITTDIQMRGEANGIDRLCGGELDITVTYNELTDEQRALCESNNVAFETVALGSEAVVLVSNAASDYLACLTTDQLATLWRAESEGQVTTWNQVNESFPQARIFLFAPGEGDSASDLLMIQSTGVASPLRPDVAEANADPLYRAAATANVEGALTLMDWSSYQQVLENDQANIQLVGVGENCVQPSEATISSGEYPLTRPLNLLISQAALSRPEVQSLLWFIASDENYTLLQDAGLVGVSFGQLPDLRASLQTMFNEAIVQAAIAAESTPEAEATAEATETGE